MNLLIFNFKLYLTLVSQPIIIFTRPCFALHYFTFFGYRMFFIMHQFLYSILSSFKSQFVIFTGGKAIILSSPDKLKKIRYIYICSHDNVGSDKDTRSLVFHFGDMLWDPQNINRGHKGPHGCQWTRNQGGEWS